MTTIISLLQDDKGIWVCSGTVIGKAVSFTATNPELARYQMVDYLSKQEGISLKEVKWGKPITWDEQQKNKQ